MIHMSLVNYFEFLMIVFETTLTNYAPEKSKIKEQVGNESINENC